MRASILLAAVLGCVLQVSGFPNKCDPKLVDAIKKLWGKNVPTNVLQTAIANGKEVVVAATVDYYPNNTKCIYSYYHPDGFVFSVIPTSGNPETTDIGLKEENGVLINLESSVMIYRVYSKGGVVAIHSCVTKGLEGNPTGMVKVSANNYKKENIEEAKKVLQTLGISTGKEYTVTCGY